MTRAPERTESLDGVLFVDMLERGALLASRRARARSVALRPNALEEPPLRHYRPGRRRHRVSVRGERITAAPARSLDTPVVPDGIACELAARMLRPWHLLTSFRFEEDVRAGEVGGRPCHLVAARALQSGLLFGAGFTFTSWPRLCDRVRVALDTDLGVALRIDADTDGVEWFRVALTDVVVDPTGAGVPDEELLDPEPVEVGAADASMVAGFAVLVPGRVPRGGAMSISVDPAAPEAWVSVERPDGRWYLEVQEQPVSAVPEEDLEVWDIVESGDRPTWIWDRSLDPTCAARRWLVTEVGGTRCSLSSTLPRDLLLAVAASLRPA